MAALVISGFELSVKISSLKNLDHPWITTETLLFNIKTLKIDIRNFSVYFGWLLVTSKIPNVTAFGSTYSESPQILVEEFQS